MKRIALRLLIVASGVACMAWAQDQPDQPEEGGPGRGVARISVMNGDVSVRRGDSGETVAAALNAPLVVEDQLLTGPNSRAEIQFDWGNMVRMAAMSEVRLAEMENQHYQLQVARGMVTFRVLRTSNAQFEISTPSVSVRPVRQGAYRIAVREDGTTEITVRSGEAEIFTPRGSERLPAGQTMLARGAVADPEFQIVRAVAPDDWDNWNENRDRQLEQSASYIHVSPDIYGAEDLDNYGTWQNEPAYGDVWYPRVAEDWAPYRDGRWSWMDWYGWNWVSYDPWGWAPYHYGRWCYTNRGWGWWPGARFGHHYWSPGLVAFVGWDSWGGRRAGLGFGGIGWIPLAPHERYFPWYGNRQYAGFRNGGRLGNLVNNFDFNGGYRNARVRNGITGVDGQGFVSGRRGSAVQMNDSRLGSASLVRGALPVTPGRESLRLSDRSVRMNTLPQTRSDTRFVSRQQPARVDRVPFEDQRRGMDQMTRRTFGAQQSSAVNNSVPAGRNQPMGSVQRGSAPAASQGWSRFGSGNAAPSSASPRYDRPAPSSPQTYRGGGQGPVRINPPIVRERAQNYNGGGGNYNRPAPSYNGPAPSYNRPAPSYNRPAPSYSRPAPSYNRPAPSYNRPAPSYSRPAPSSGGGGRNNGGGGGRQSGRTR